MLFACKFYATFETKYYMIMYTLSGRVGSNLFLRITLFLYKFSLISSLTTPHLTLNATGIAEMSCKIQCLNKYPI